MAQRLATRVENAYGQTAKERSAALGDLDTVEPLLRATADRIIEARVLRP